jgi:CHAT domain-containing protein
LSVPKQPTELDDGLLTASEVAQLRLNADWVLSVCNTIAGDKPGAEALSDLARSFFYAGARALLVSHWAAASEAASRLTIATFDRLKSSPKIGRAEALRQAMLNYLNDASSSRNAHPAFWGPFALIGEGAARQIVVRRNRCVTTVVFQNCGSWSRFTAEGLPAACADQVRTAAYD